MAKRSWNWRRYGAAYELDSQTRQFVLEENMAEFRCSEIYEKIFNLIAGVAQQDALSNQESITKAIAQYPYLRSLYKDVSEDACRRAIYHEAYVKSFMYKYEKQYRSTLEDFVDRIYKASPMAVFVQSSKEDPMVKKAAESAAKAYKQKINSMVWNWTKQVYDMAFWAEARKVIDKAMSQEG